MIEQQQRPPKSLLTWNCDYSNMNICFPLLKMVIGCILEHIMVVYKCALWKKLCGHAMLEKNRMLWQ